MKWLGRPRLRVGEAPRRSRIVQQICVRQTEGNRLGSQSKSVGERKAHGPILLV